MHYNVIRNFNKYFNICPQPANLKLLKKIVGSFSKIPYENISKIIKNNDIASNQIRLPQDVFNDYIQYNLGGTCFSLTFFLQTILEAHNFLAYPLLANMRYGKNCHCALIVIINSSRYLIDPGYLLNTPMLLDPEKRVVFHSEISGIELTFYREADLIDLYTFNSIEKKWRYQLTDRPVSTETFMKHWQASLKWNSMNSLCLTKIEKGCMTYIHRTYMSKISGDLRKNFKIKNNLSETINFNFAIDPEITEKALEIIESRKNKCLEAIHPEPFKDYK